MITNMFHQLCLYQLWYFILLPVGIQYPSKPLFRRLLMISGGLGESMVGRRRQVKSKHGFFLITYAGQKTERACLIHTYQLHRAHVYMYSCTPVDIPVWARLSCLGMQYSITGNGVSRPGIQNEKDFCIKINILKGNFDILQTERMASR